MVHILALAGSPEDDEKFNVSLLYAEMIGCHEVKDHVFSYAAIFPDKQWCFPNNFCNENVRCAEKISIADAIKSMQLMKPDVIISALYCRSGHVLYSSLIQLLGLTLIGPNTEAAVITSNKIITRRMLEHAGVPMPPCIIFSRNESTSTEMISRKVGFPCVVKAPCAEDSTGTFLVKQPENLHVALEACEKLGDGIVIEKYIPGREIRSGVLEDANGNLIFLPVIEYKIEGDFRTTEDKFPRREDGTADLEKKHAKGRSEFLEGSAHLALLNKIEEYSFLAFRTLLCRGYALFDIRVDPNDNPYFLEANLYCSFGPHSIINVMTKQMGISGKETLSMAISNAFARENK